MCLAAPSPLSFTRIGIRAGTGRILLFVALEGPLNGFFVAMLLDGTTTAVVEFAEEATACDIDAFLSPFEKYRNL